MKFWKNVPAGAIFHMEMIIYKTDHMAWWYVVAGEVPFNPMCIMSDSLATLSYLLENPPLSQGSK